MSRITIDRGALVTHYEPYNLPGAEIPVRWQVYDQHGAPLGAKDNYYGPGGLLRAQDGKRRELRVGADNAVNFAWYTVDDNPTPESDEYDRGYRAGWKRAGGPTENTIGTVTTTRGGPLTAADVDGTTDYNDGVRDGHAAGKKARKAPKQNPRPARRRENPFTFTDAERAEYADRIRSPLAPPGYPRYPKSLVDALKLTAEQRCLDCGEPMRRSDHYMVKPAIWRAVNPPTQEKCEVRPGLILPVSTGGFGYLHVPCLEKRLGRLLQPKDYIKDRELGSSFWANTYPNAKQNPRRPMPARNPRPDADAKAYKAAVLASRKAAERRRNLPPGSSRAAVTTANARWASAAEYRDRLGQELPAGVRAKVDAEIRELPIAEGGYRLNPSPRTLAWSASGFKGTTRYEATRAGKVYALAADPDGWIVTVNGKQIGSAGDSRTARLIAEKHAGPAVIPFKRRNPGDPEDAKILAALVGLSPVALRSRGMGSGLRYVIDFRAAPSRSAGHNDNTYSVIVAGHEMGGSVADVRALILSRMPRQNPRPPKMIPTSPAEAAQWLAEAADLDGSAARAESLAANVEATQGMHAASPYHQQAFAQRERAASLRAGAKKFAPPEPKKRAAPVKAECPPPPPCPRCGYPAADTRPPAVGPAPVTASRPPPPRPPEVWLESDLKGTQGGLFSRKNPRTCRCRPARRKNPPGPERYAKVKALAERGATEHERATAARILATMEPPPRQSAPPPAEKRYEWHAPPVDAATRAHQEREWEAATAALHAERAERLRQAAAARETLRTLRPGDKVEVVFDPKSSTSPPDKRTVTITEVKPGASDSYYAFTTSGRVMPGNVTGGMLRDGYGDFVFQTTMTASPRRVISLRILARANPRRRGHR